MNLYDVSFTNFASVYRKMSSRRLNDEEMRQMLFDIPSDYEDDTEDEIDDDVTTIVLDDNCAIYNLPVVDGNVNEEDEITLNVNAEKKCESTGNKNTQKDVPRKWKKKPEPVPDTTFRHHGTKKMIDANTPVEAFLQFFDDSILDKILYETNLKSVQNSKPAAIAKEELLCFFGINIVMCFHKLPSIAHYWSSHKVYAVEPIINAMNRERFQTILKWLHVNDNSKIDKTDKVYKVRPLLDHLNAKFMELKLLSEHLSVDESVILFKGRSSLKQYNPMKPIKRGFKLWCLCDDTGYLYRTSVYTGKNEATFNQELRKEVGLGGDVVLSLLSSVSEKNHKAYFDNYFSSLPLMELLKSKNILACGTIRSNRKDLPKNFTSDKELRRGEYDYRSTSDGITVYKWCDSKPVHFVSNYHGISETTVQRKDKTGAKLTVPCPDVVDDYNKHMGGVDKHDMLRQKYGIDRKSKKWWHRLFFGMFDMAIVNAYILYYERFPDEKKPIADFKADVGLGLLTFASERRSCGAVKRRKTQYSTPDSVRLSNVGIHKIRFTTVRGRCPVCSMNGIQSKPLSKCAHCNVHLCCNQSKDCFNIYHT